MEGYVNSILKAGAIISGATSGGMKDFADLSTRQKHNLIKAAQDIALWASFMLMKYSVGSDELKRTNWMAWRSLMSIEYAIQDLTTSVSPGVYIQTITEPLPVLALANNLKDMVTYFMIGDFERSAYIGDRLMPLYSTRRGAREFIGRNKLRNVFP